MFDEYPEVQIGDWIRFTKDLDDEGNEVARPNDLGHIIDKRPGYLPTVVCERTGRVYDCDLDEFEVVCDADFARTPESTPKKQMKKFVRPALRLAKVN